MKSKCKCIWNYCTVAKRIALKTACAVCYPVEDNSHIHLVNHSKGTVT